MNKEKSRWKLNIYHLLKKRRIKKFSSQPQIYSVGIEVRKVNWDAILLFFG